MIETLGIVCLILLITFALLPIVLAIILGREPKEKYDVKICHNCGGDGEDLHGYMPIVCRICKGVGILSSKETPEYFKKRPKAVEPEEKKERTKGGLYAPGLYPEEGGFHVPF